MDLPMLHPKNSNARGAIIRVRVRVRPAPGPLLEGVHVLLIMILIMRFRIGIIRRARLDITAHRACMGGCHA